MTSEEILQALQVGKISLEDAKKALIAGVTQPLRSSGLSAGTVSGQRSDLASSAASSEREPVVSSGAIAIVGMSGKYPDAHNLANFWDNLVQGKNAIREIPLSRFDVSDYYDPNPAQKGKIYCKELGVLDEIEYFDPLFFHISPAEAEAMDPQQRLFLEEGYKAFEDAGYSPQLLSNRKCGVYLGIGSHEYRLLLSEQKDSEADLLGTNSAIAAARLAYLLNLKGPAISIDTACSSSLVATHLACQALRTQEVDMALVGGVSLCLTPGFYVRMCNAWMLSPEGQCKTFDASANGFVPGEGVGALVLKRLDDAEADHDQIYGLIIASGMNQDGTTSGITAPSMKSQIELEREIYEKYQIDPASISYVEMHGTGTKLGDPIELEALSTVFQEKTQRKQFCAIGSVKTNIGHTLAAAGVAGLQKVLLAMQQKKLVPTLHFQQPNEHFDFATSPFYVNTEVQNWKSEAGVPRRAAVSSFGFSGTNAHVVIEEYISRRDADSGPRPPETPILFVLSAKSEQQLKSYAQEMKLWIQAHEELALQDIAFTLQLGREAMDYRLAIVADSREILLQRLERFFTDNQTSTGVHIAHIKKGTHDATLFDGDEDGQSLLHIWCQKKFAKIAQVWVKGANVDWKLLYTLEPGQAGDIGEASSPMGLAPVRLPTPHRVSLPTYPFARERYWIPATTGSTMAYREEPFEKPRPQASLFAALHPLVQRNISTLWEQRFSSTFRGDEFFLADHVVKGQRIMPGVAYLEMARAAVREAIGADTSPSYEKSHLYLNHVVWVRPLIVGELPVTVHITLERQDNETITFVISHEGQEEETEARIYCQGTASVGQAQDRRNAPPKGSQHGSSLHNTVPNVDLASVQARCQHQISAASCYQRYREIGMSYGPALQGIEQLSVGEDEVLARLRLPESVTQTQTDFVLHPSLLDAALQASIGLWPDFQEPHLPFELEELSIEGEGPAQGWAWVRRRRVGTGTGASPTSVLDIEVCDDEGRIAVRLRGLSTRMPLSANALPARQDAGASPAVAGFESRQGQAGRERTGASPVHTSTSLVGTLKLTPHWDPVALSQQTSDVDPTNQIVAFRLNPLFRQQLLHVKDLIGQVGMLRCILPLPILQKGFGDIAVTVLCDGCLVRL